jgi:hypothetical protein
MTDPAGWQRHSGQVRSHRSVADCGPAQGSFHLVGLFRYPGLPVFLQKESVPIPGVRPNPLRRKRPQPPHNGPRQWSDTGRMALRRVKRAGTGMKRFAVRPCRSWDGDRESGSLRVLSSHTTVH